MSFYKSLDVGCGANPRGNVNVDLYPKDRRQCITNYDPKTIQNFIIADCEHLPSRDKIFLKSYAFSVLEHLENPLSGLKELNRDSRYVVLRVPSSFNVDLFSFGDTTETHIYSWNEKTLFNLLNFVFINIKIQCVNRRIRLYGRLGKYFSILKYILKRFPTYYEVICWN